MMPNALSPPPPPPEMSQPPQGGNALAPAGGAPGMQQGQQPQGNALVPPMPAPSHAQTVAALLHFRSIEAHIVKLLRDPEIGRANLRHRIIDGFTDLVSKGMITPTMAAQQLAEVPERPYDQRQFLIQKFQETVGAAHAVLTHHMAAFAGQEMDDTAPGSDDHLAVMGGLNDHYVGFQKKPEPNALARAVSRG